VWEARDRRRVRLRGRRFRREHGANITVNEDCRGDNPATPVAVRIKRSVVAEDKPKEHKLKKHKKALMEQAAHPASIDKTNTEIATDTTAADTTATNIVLTQWDKAWQGYCKFIVGLRPDEWAQFQTDLQNGRVPQVDPALMAAAGALVAGMADEGVRSWDWLPAPSTDDLSDAVTWASRRLAARRAEQDAAERSVLWQRKLARAQGRTPPAGNGTINPIHLQQPKRSLEEMGRRLERAMGREGFKREWLDHRSSHYVSDRDGGISNKQIVLMANLIVGRQERRPYDQNWKIVEDWLRERQAKESSSGAT
jgi:hypothetical protein